MDLAGDGETAFLTRLGANRNDFEYGVVRELTARRRDRTTFPLDVALSPVILPTSVHLVAVIRDISERRGDEAAVRFYRQSRAEDALDLDRGVFGPAVGGQAAP